MRAGCQQLSNLGIVFLPRPFTHSTFSTVEWLSMLCGRRFLTQGLTIGTLANAEWAMHGKGACWALTDRRLR